MSIGGDVTRSNWATNGDSADDIGTAAQNEPNKVIRFADYSATRAKPTSREPGPWQALAIRKLAALVNLPANWDSYKAPAIDRQVGMFVLEILQKIMSSTVPDPIMVPTAVGGIQIEWHEGDIDFEIHVVAPYKGDAFFRDDSRNETLEFALSDDMRMLSELAKRLPARAGSRSYAAH